MQFTGILLELIFIFNDLEPEMEVPSLNLYHY